MKYHNVAIIGTGRVGSNLAIQFFQKGYSIVSLIDLELNLAKTLAPKVACPLASTQLTDLSSSADILLITTSDKLIENTCRQLSELPIFFENKLVLHCSGALDSRVLDSVRVKGARVASMHPVQTFLPIENGQTRLENVFFGIEGDEIAREKVRSIVQTLGGNSFEIPVEGKELYHAACAIASNYLVALVQMSIFLFEKLGIDEKQGLKILAPLLESTLQNIKQTNPAAALTGPLARGDVETVEKHLQMIQAQVPVVLNSYIDLGQILLQLCKSREKMDSATIQIFEQLFRNFTEE